MEGGVGGGQGDPLQGKAKQCKRNQFQAFNRKVNNDLRN